MQEKRSTEDPRGLQDRGIGMRPYVPLAPGAAGGGAGRLPPQLPLASRLSPGRGPAVNPREMKTERSEGKNGEILGAQAVLNENSTKRDAERRFRISTASANRIRTRNSPAARKTSPAGKRPGFAPPRR